MYLVPYSPYGQKQCRPRSHQQGQTEDSKGIPEVAGAMVDKPHREWAKISTQVSQRIYHPHGRSGDRAR